MFANQRKDRLQTVSPLRRRTLVVRSHGVTITTTTTEVILGITRHLHAQTVVIAIILVVTIEVILRTGTILDHITEEIAQVGIILRRGRTTAAGAILDRTTEETAQAEVTLVVTIEVLLLIGVTAVLEAITEEVVQTEVLVEATIGAAALTVVLLEVGALLAAETITGAVTNTG